jgi:hypothetical protein
LRWPLRCWKQKQICSYVPTFAEELATNLALTVFSEVQHSPVSLAGAFGTGRGLFSPKRKHWYVERTSMIAHIYSWVLRVVLGRGYAGCLERVFSGVPG